MADLAETIAANAAEPKSASADGVTMTQHSLRDQIEADQYLKQQMAGNKRKLPIRLAQITPGGAQ